MCNQCVDLEKQIARYRKIIRQFSDALTAVRIKEAIVEMEAKKASLH